MSNLDWGAVTIVHEWLTVDAGSESVVRTMTQHIPGATVASSMCRPGAFAELEPVRTSRLVQWAAKDAESHRRVLPLLPFAMRGLDLPPCDLTIVSYHTFGLHVRPNSERVLVYCHAPTRFLWPNGGLEADTWGRRAMAGAARCLRPLERRRSERFPLFVANSRAVSARIAAAFGRQAHVLAPPVDTTALEAGRDTPDADYYLCLGRLVPYKRVDLAVRAFATMPGRRLIVAGDGRDRTRLEAMASPNVEFLGRVADERLPSLLGGARALIFPGEEDFGITPVEAMATGTPVIAYGAGGVLDTVVEDESGVFFHDQTVAALVDALGRFERSSFDASRVASAATPFHPARFMQRLHDLARQA